MRRHSPKSFLHLWSRQVSGSWALLGHLQQCFCKTMLGFNWNVHQQPAVCANHALNPMPSHHHPKSSPYDVNGSYKPSPSHGRVYMGLWHWVAPQKMPIPDFTAKLAKFGPPRFLTPTGCLLRRCRSRFPWTTSCDQSNFPREHGTMIMTISSNNNDI